MVSKIVGEVIPLKSNSENIGSTLKCVQTTYAFLTKMVSQFCSKKKEASECQLLTKNQAKNTWLHQLAFMPNNVVVDNTEGMLGEPLRWDKSIAED